MNLRMILDWKFSFKEKITNYQDFIQTHEYTLDVFFYGT